MTRPPLRCASSRKHRRPQQRGFAIMLAAKDQAVADAQAKSAETETKLARLAEQYDVALNERLGSQREILEKAKDEAVNIGPAKTEEHAEAPEQSLGIAARARQQNSRGAGRRRRGQSLRSAAEGISRRPHRAGEKGCALGADIHHVVMHRGRECGTIIYNSKNHKAFRSEHVAKLAEDQIAARAEHAILSLHKFPKGTGQLHMHEGVRSPIPRAWWLS